MRFMFITRTVTADLSANPKQHHYTVVHFICNHHYPSLYFGDCLSQLPPSHRFIKKNIISQSWNKQASLIYKSSDFKTMKSKRPQELEAERLPGDVMRCRRLKITFMWSVLPYSEPDVLRILRETRAGTNLQQIYEIVHIGIIHHLQKKKKFVFLHSYNDSNYCTRCKIRFLNCYEIEHRYLPIFSY